MEQYINPALNIFNSYDKGRLKYNTIKEHGKESLELDLESLSKLENNVTRAFLSTLCHLSTKGKIKLIQEFLCPVLEIKEVKEDDSVIVNVQSSKKFESDYKVNNYLNKILLIINSYGSVKVEKKELTENPIPDGWILFDNYSICLESKLFSVPSENQIRGYFKKFVLNYDKNKSLVKTVHWETLEGHARALSIDKSLNNTDRFLLEQLSDFLAFQSLGKFIMSDVEKANNLYLMELKNRALKNETDLSDNYNYFKLKFIKIKNSLTSIGNNEWRLRVHKPDSEIAIIQDECPAKGLSLNVFMAKGKFSISVYAGNNESYVDLYKKIADKNILNQLETKTGVKFFISAFIEHKKGKALNFPPNDFETVVDNLELSNSNQLLQLMEKKEKEIKKKYNFEKNIGKRISIHTQLTDNFFKLEKIED